MNFQSKITQETSDQDQPYFLDGYISQDVLSYQNNEDNRLSLDVNLLNSLNIWEGLDPNKSADHHHYDHHLPISELWPLLSLNYQ